MGTKSILTVVLTLFFCFYNYTGVYSLETYYRGRTYPAKKKVEIQSVVQVAEANIGIREKGKNNHGKTVAKYLASVGFDEGAPWCGAFVYYCHQQAGINLPGKPRGYAWSPNWFPKDKKTYDHRTHSREPDIKPGDVFGIWFNSKGRIAHVGILVRKYGRFYHTIEGNTNDGGSRDGDGVFGRKRSIKHINQVSRWAN